jgi:2-methylisocitrate lyase-like PEP mutase family enzyme
MAYATPLVSRPNAFIPGLFDKRIISEIVGELDFPTNILATAQSPTIHALKDLGVARVTFGSGPMRATLKLLQQMAQEILGDGTYSMLEQTVPPAQMNELMR